MTSRICLHAAVVVTATLGFAACGGSSSPTQPTSLSRTETFTGTFEPGGGVVHAFASDAGNALSTITAVNPADAVFGYSLGVWDGTTCTARIFTDTAKQGAVYLAYLDSAGNYCVRVYDVSGTVDSVTYTVTVQHPAPAS